MRQFRWNAGSSGARGLYSHTYVYCAFHADSILHMKLLCKPRFCGYLRVIIRLIVVFISMIRAYLRLLSTCDRRQKNALPYYRFKIEDKRTRCLIIDPKSKTGERSALLLFRNRRQKKAVITHIR